MASAEQRYRATEAWVEADRYMMGFAYQSAERNNDYITSDTVIEAVRKFLSDGEQCQLSNRLGFSARDLMDEQGDKFWYMYQQWTGEEVAEEKRSSPFGCCI